MVPYLPVYAMSCLSFLRRKYNTSTKYNQCEGCGNHANSIAVAGISTFNSLLLNWPVDMFDISVLCPITTNGLF